MESMGACKIKSAISRNYYEHYYVNYRRPFPKNWNAHHFGFFTFQNFLQHCCMILFQIRIRNPKLCIIGCDHRWIFPRNFIHYFKSRNYVCIFNKKKIGNKTNVIVKVLSVHSPCVMPFMRNLVLCTKNLQ